MPFSFSVCILGMDMMFSSLFLQLHKMDNSFVIGLVLLLLLFFYCLTNALSAVNEKRTISQ